MQPKAANNAQYVTADESRYSAFFAQMTEHVFIAELLQEAYYAFGKRVEVLRSEVDAYGYDLALECNGRAGASKSCRVDHFEEVGRIKGAA